MPMSQDYAVFCGLDVGKEAQHATALTPDGERVFDAPMPQGEAELRELFTDLSEHGSVLVIVDQPNTIGALPVAVARETGCEVAYLPGLAMRRMANLHPGTAKTDARDAYVIADAGRVMPHALRPVDVGEEALAELTVLVGFDDDLAAEATRLTNRIRGLLTQVHPALERVLGPKVGQKATLALLAKFGGPEGFKQAGKRRLLTVARKANPRGAEELVEAIWIALGEQTVVVPGMKAADQVLPKLAASLTDTLDQRAQIAAQVEEVLDAHLPHSLSTGTPLLAGVLTSMPGVGVRSAARILLEVGDGSTFPTSGHLAAYAGLAPVTRRSGTSIKGEFPARSGNKHLKRAFFLSAFAALRADPISRAYYDKKRAQGKKHNAALICLARRRCDVLHAMLRNGAYYDPPAQAA